MFESFYPYPGQQEIVFPVDPIEALIERRAREALAEIEQMKVRALEAIDRRLAFHKRSQGQRERFARYRSLHRKDAP